MGWLPEGLAAAVVEFRRLTEPHPWAHAVWLMPTVLLGAWLVGKFFEWVRPCWSLLGCGWADRAPWRPPGPWHAVPLTLQAVSGAAAVCSCNGGIGEHCNAPVHKRPLPPKRRGHIYRRIACAMHSKLLPSRMLASRLQNVVLQLDGG